MDFDHQQSTDPETGGTADSGHTVLSPNTFSPLAGPGWRDHLHRLEGLDLVLLPIGARPPDRKAPVDPKTGHGLKDWQHHPGFTVAEILAMPQDRVIGTGINTGPSGLEVLDLDGAAAVAWVAAHGVDPRDPALFRITRTTDPDRFKILFRPTPEQRAQLPERKLLLPVGPPDDNGKREVVELYAKSGAQVVAIGHHAKSGGWYDWAGDPSQISAPSDEWFAVLLTLRQEVEKLRSLGDTSRPKVRGLKVTGAWRASSHRDPCPLCGRDHSAACTRSVLDDGRDIVSCYHGGAFSAPDCRESGETVVGKDGREWGFCRRYYAECIGEKSLFVVHRPMAPKAARRDPTDAFEVISRPAATGLPFLVKDQQTADTITAHGFRAVAITAANGLEDLDLGGQEVLLYLDPDDDLPGLCLALITAGVHPRILQIPSEIDGTANTPASFIARHGAAAFGELHRAARPCGNWHATEPCKRFTWTPEPKLTHHKAVMAWTVFDNYALRPGFGFYRWCVDHWAPMPGRDTDAITPLMHRWMDAMGHEQRSSSVIGSVRAELAARLHSERWDPPELMAFKNGTLNIKTGAFTLGHRREDGLTFCFPFPLDREATCPLWHQFLATTLGDSELIRLMRAAIRWTLLPKDREQPFPYELAFDVHGPRGGGKGTLSEVLQAVCGGLGGGAGLVRSDSFSNPNALHSLIGKRAAIDPDASGRIGDVGVFNSVVSNEPVSVKKLYSDCQAERLGVVVWRFFNDQPGASGGGLEGMGRRIVPFRFEKPVANPDRHLKAKLTAEVAGIFWWAWSMDHDDMHDALCNVGEVRKIREAAVDAALERSPILRFLVEKFPDGRERIPASVLFMQWGAWAKQAGHEPGSSTRFGREVKKISAVKTHKDKTATTYSIEAMDGFDLARHIGITSPGGGLVVSSAQPTTNPPPNPPPLDPLVSLASEEAVVGSVGFSPKNTSQEKKGEKGEKGGQEAESHMGEGCAANPPNSPPPPETAVVPSDLAVVGSVVGCGGLEQTHHQFAPGDRVRLFTAVLQAWHGGYEVVALTPDGLVKIRSLSTNSLQNVRPRNLRPESD